MTLSPGYLISKQSKGDYIITMAVSRQFYEECLEMLEDIRKSAAIGHSFSVVVDPDKKGGRKYFVDGDGASHIYKITVEKG